MRESIKEKIEIIDKLLLDPFNPEPLERALAELLEELKTLDKEEALELNAWLNELYKRLEENHKTALGWLEELSKRSNQGLKA